LIVITIDSTIVNVALPTFARELHAGAGAMQWFVDAYTLAITALLLFAGALGDRFGRRHALAAGLALFAVGSLFAAFSSSSGELIAARALMGVGAAAIMPSTLSILIDVFSEPRERAHAIAIWAGISGLGVAIGPTLGGWLLEHFAWGAVFLVNLPIVAVALFGVWRVVPASRAARATRLDLTGLLLAASGLTALTWVLISAPDHGWLSATTLGAGAAACVPLALFLWWERRTPEPLMDLSLFREPRFSAGSLAITIVFFVLFGTLFAYTQIVQIVLGHSALTAGLCAVPMAVALGVCAPLSAHLAGRLGAHRVVTAGLLTVAAGLGLIATATTATGLGQYTLALALMGAGMGLTIAPSTDAIMSAVPSTKVGVGSAVNDTTREFGGVLGVAVLGSLIASGYAAELRPVTRDLGATLAGSAESSLLGALSVARELGGDQGRTLARAAREAFVAAATQSAVAAAVLSGVSAVAVGLWLAGAARRPDTEQREAGVAHVTP
jgi:EmrB/QacA subfamily drug resistance transporter